VPVGNDVSLDGKRLSPEVRLVEYFRGPPHFGNVDGQRLHESFEGWVQVRIASPEPDDRFPLFEGLGPFPLAGVLTWTNVA